MINNTKLNILFILIILTGCNKNVPTRKSPIIYKPVDSEILEDIEPYNKQPKPTLKEKLKLQQEQECLDRIKESYKHPLHTEKPSILQEIIDSYSCS
jgi:hypothetical protein